jgi:hypothetical protein
VTESRPAPRTAPEQELERLHERAELARWGPAGREVRPGSWAQQAEPTPQRIRRALDEARFGDAAALGRHLITEAQEIHDLYTDWSAAVPQILARHGATEQRLRAAAEEAVGEPGAVDPAADWQGFLDAVREFAQGCEAGGGCETSRGGHERSLAAALQAWRTAHDRHRDLVAWWIAFAVQELGETQLGDLWRELQAEGIASYARYDVNATRWDESFAFLVQCAIEGMHGHLGGPHGLGEVEVRDHGDRVQLTFAPCGSGGRLRAAERFGVTGERHDWAWNELGVCHYCVHCCVLQQVEPIDNLGYPARVIDPPLAAGESCSWTVYRDPRDVPESAYSRVGRRKPS